MFIISEKTSESLDRVLRKSQRIETSKRDINLSPMKINTRARYHQSFVLLDDGNVVRFLELARTVARLEKVFDPDFGVV